MDNAKDFNLLNQFLAINTYQKDKIYDLILVCGNAIPKIVLDAYQLYHKGQAHYFMVAGGKGHTTEWLINTMDQIYEIEDINNKSEAELFQYIIEDAYTLDRSILLEKESTNCGENILFAFEMLKKRNIPIQEVLLVHDPLMQRRIDATARHYFPNIHFDNYSCFIPEVEDNGFYCHLTNCIWGLWSMDRYITLLLGEMKRIKDDEGGYGPKGRGYISHVDIPSNILESYYNILKQYRNYQRE